MAQVRAAKKTEIPTAAGFFRAFSAGRTLFKHPGFRFTPPWAKFFSRFAAPTCNLSHETEWTDS
jgi:hypothetical protein